MPTLASLAFGHTVPPCPLGASAFTTAECTEGVSLVPLMRDPTAAVKNASFSQFPRPYSGAAATASWSAGAVSPCLTKNCTMGYTLVTKAVGGAELRYTEWAAFGVFSDHKPDWSHLVGVELYNHSSDPGETANLAKRPELAAVAAQLSAALRAGPPAAAAQR